MPKPKRTTPQPAGGAPGSFRHALKASIDQDRSGRDTTDSANLTYKHVCKVLRENPAVREDYLLTYAGVPGIKKGKLYADDSNPWAAVVRGLVLDEGMALDEAERNAVYIDPSIEDHRDAAIREMRAKENEANAAKFAALSQRVRGYAARASAAPSVAAAPPVAPPATVVPAAPAPAFRGEAWPLSPTPEAIRESRKAAAGEFKALLSAYRAENLRQGMNSGDAEVEAYRRARAEHPQKHEAYVLQAQLEMNRR